MPFELIKPTPQDIPTLAHVFFHAFKELLDRYNLPLDIPSVEVATGAMNSFVNRPDFYGIAARIDGRLIGSNFVSYADAVAGVGPITVEPALQAKGIGKALMQHVVEHALANHGPQVRLVQDAINMVSLSLYTSLGFGVQEPLVLLTFPPSPQADPTVRPVTPNDVDACGMLIERVYRVSRKNELLAALAHGKAHGMVPFLRERGGRVVACAIPGFFGFGVAETNDDLFAVLTSGARDVPPFMARFLCPSRNADLYRQMLRAGARALRGLHLMSIGPYETPQGAWYPSIAY